MEAQQDNIPDIPMYRTKAISPKSILGPYAGSYENLRYDAELRNVDLGLRLLNPLFLAPVFSSNKGYRMMS